MIPFTKKAKNLEKIRSIMEKIKKEQTDSQKTKNFSIFNSKYGKEMIDSSLERSMKDYDSNSLETSYQLLHSWDAKGFMSEDLGNYLESLIDDEKYQIGIHRVSKVVCPDPHDIHQNDTLYSICSKGLYLTGHSSSGGYLSNGKNPLYLNISPINNLLHAVEFAKSSYKGSTGGFIIALPSEYVDKELNIKNGHENDLCGYVDGEWALDPKYIVGYISQDEGVCNFFTRAEIMYEYEKNKENHSTK